MYLSLEQQTEYTVLSGHAWLQKFSALIAASLPVLNALSVFFD